MTSNVKPLKRACIYAKPGPGNFCLKTECDCGRRPLAISDEKREEREAVADFRREMREHRRYG